MDFSRFKPGQKACITTLDAPLVVSAGAGSGKTFTLTQRIAWALMEGSGRDGGAFLDGIEQVMAITFTEKAAGEIKSRVKSTLRAEGMANEALKVDDAWISTIHGMCSRILRTHAVELGIDPSFSVLDPARSDELIHESVAEALADGRRSVGLAGMNALFAEFPARSSGGFGSDSIEAMLVSLVRTAAASPEGCDCFVRPPHVREASLIARGLVGTVEEFREVSLTQKATATRDKWLQDADDFLEKAYGALASSSFDADALIRLCAECPWPPARGSAEYKALAADAQKACASLIMEARYLLAEPLLSDLLKIARCAYGRFVVRKKELCSLDNDDLLIQAAAALKDHADIAREFSDKFKLIMVDEFQDTDQLQIDMISRMAGEGGCRLCTVGDAQQSIYRFRGADVQVYKRHLEKVRRANPEGLIELPDNFRSHGDVLAFVDRIFEQGNVFGKEFMSLAPSRFESSVKKPFLGDDTRVNVLLTTYPERSGIESVDVTRYEAGRIAGRFAELREKGHSAGDMVILLGRMTRAGVFADALRAAGFACVIAGGSIFSSAPEVRIMQALVEVIANPRATAAVFELLSSDMFLLSADDFIVISTMFDEKESLHRRRRIDAGLASLADVLEENPEAVTPQLAHAVRIMKDIGARAGKDSVSRIMSDAVRDSGWLSRLEEMGAEGQSVAGNVLKAIRVVESIEMAGCCGPSSVAEALASHLGTAKEAPGALSAQGGDFVRIMTVHASKGLEFPIVAVAEMGMTKARSSSFSCGTIDGAAYVGLSPSRSLSRYGSSSPVKKAADKKYRIEQEQQLGYEPGSAEAVVSAVSPMQRMDALAEYESEQELQERRRLLYVALTRAKEALIMSMVSARSSSDPDGSGVTEKAGVYNDIRTALFSDGDFPPGESRVTFGGSLPAVVERVDTLPEDYGSESAEGSSSFDGGSVSIPLLSFDTRREDFLLPRSCRGVASFTALSSVETEDSVFSGEVFASEGDAALYPEDDEAFWDALETELSRDSDSATDMGTAFHMLAQQAVALRKGNSGRLVRPDDSLVSSIMQSCGLGDSIRGRLTAALDRWLSSDAAHLSESCDSLVAELPFFVSLDRGADVCAGMSSAEGRFLEGSIDLFGELSSGRKALIVDYKTGGRPDEARQELREKHYLQAACYSFAVLLQGYEETEALFVRVEHEDVSNPGQPQVVSYRFFSDDLDRLGDFLAQAYDSWNALNR